MKNIFYSKAIELHSNNFAVLPTHNNEKRPVGIKWKNIYNSDRKPTKNELKKLLEDKKTTGLAIICGSVSNNIEVIDFDNHLNNAKTIYEDFIKIVNSQDDSIIPKCYIEKTQSGGFHLCYRCSSSQSKSKKLAMDYFNESNKKTTLIELLAKDKLCVIEPTQGYEKISKCSLIEIEEISKTQLDILINTAKSFNKVASNNSLNSNSNSKYDNNSQKVGDFYNEKCSNNDVINLLSEYGWQMVYNRNDTYYLRRPNKFQGSISATWNHIPNRLFVFTTNALPFEEEKTYHAFAIYTLLKHNGDFKNATKDLAKKLNLEYHFSDSLSNSFVDKETGEVISIPYVFWYEKKKELKIKHHKLLDMLKDKGICLYYHNRKSKENSLPLLVQVNKNIVSIINKNFLDSIVMDYINSLPDDISDNHTKTDLLETYLQGITNYLNERKFAYFPVIYDSDFYKASEFKTCFFFKSKLVSITNKKIKVENYSNLNDKLVWESDIKDFDIDFKFDNEKYYDFLKYEHSPKNDFFVLFEKLFSDNDFKFYQFLKNVCTDKNKKELDVKRFNALMCAIGYLINTYRGADTGKAIVFTEETISDVPQGRKGKGVIMKAVSKMVDVVEISGKTVDFNKDFTLQMVNRNTKVIHFNDVKKKFNFEDLFNLITDGIEIKKKYEQSFYLDSNEAPLSVLNTNYSILDDNDSTKGRKYDVVLKDYYNAKFTPKEEFNQMFFSNEYWDNKEWKMFYFLMFYCAFRFLNNNRQVPQDYNLESKEIKTFINFYFQDVWDSLENEIIPEKTKYQFNTLYDACVDDGIRKYYSKKKFVKAVQMYCDIKGYKFDKSDEKVDGTTVRFYNITSKDSNLDVNNFDGNEFDGVGF